LAIFMYYVLCMHVCVVYSFAEWIMEHSMCTHICGRADTNRRSVDLLPLMLIYSFLVLILSCLCSVHYLVVFIVPPLLCLTVEPGCRRRYRVSPCLHADQTLAQVQPSAMTQAPTCVLSSLPLCRAILIFLCLFMNKLCH